MGSYSHLTLLQTIHEDLFPEASRILTPDTPMEQVGFGDHWSQEAWAKRLNRLYALSSDEIDKAQTMEDLSRLLPPV
ncbi:hypothetical protein [Pontibacter sp. G13]|uniref:hypothetical protein n=1 Tax=Pontibacter sp. G13 TaxID=3074898 RepID=UPI00288B6A42|nr:hypothetical protein [Pontibacter sp. G13]WNJ18925.1 hypothetical protein RJD25_00420 [Pontibacter sp. G13]